VLGEIYGARVAPQGTLLDTVPIPILVRENLQTMPQVSFGGGVFLVVWQDDYLTRYVPHIAASRVNLQGKVLDPQGFQVSFGDSSEEWPGLSFDGTNFLAVWSGLKAAGAGFGVWAARISPSGAVLDSPAVCLALDGVYKDDAAVGINGTNYLVVWTEGRYDVKGARLTPSGTLLDTIPLSLARVPDLVGRPSVASDGAKWLLAWEDYRLTFRVYGTLVHPDGSSLYPDGIPLSDPGSEQYDPVVAWDGGQYLCLWEDDRTQAIGDTSDVYGVFLDTLVQRSGVVEKSVVASPISHSPFSVRPNPFTSYTSVPSHSSERFALYDISGRKVGTYKGDRIGEGLSAGVYFLKSENSKNKPLRIVKVR
jgi:hypothetical protein